MLSIAREDLPRLLQRLRDDGRRLLGPTVRDGAMGIIVNRPAGSRVPQRATSTRMATSG